MKVTVLSSLPPVKGVSKYTAGLLSGLSKYCDIDALGFKRIYPDALYPGGTKDMSLRPISMRNVTVKNYLSWYNPFGWFWAGISVKGKVLHAQWWSYVLAPVYLTVLSLAKFIRRKKVLITVHNVRPHEPGLLRGLANKSVFALGDHFIVHTQENKQDLVEVFHADPSRVTVIPHGTLVPDAQISGLTREDAKSRLGIGKGKHVILLFGIIRAYKGLDTLLEAIARVRKQNPDILLVVAGNPWEGWDKYQEIIDRHDLHEFVKTDLRFIPEEAIEPYFAAADLVALPYKHFDAQSGAGSLALPFGRALVVTNTGGLPDLVKDPAAIAKPDDPVDLADKISHILDDDELQRRLEQNSLDISQNLSWDKIGKDTLDLYESL